MPPEHDKLVQYYMRKWIVIILFLFLMDVRINFAPLCLVSEICSLFHLTCKGNVCVCVCMHAGLSVCLSSFVCIRILFFYNNRILLWLFSILQAIKGGRVL